MTEAHAITGPVDNSASATSHLKTLPLNAVVVDGGFWREQQFKNRETSGSPQASGGGKSGQPDRQDRRPVVSTQI